MALWNGFQYSEPQSIKTSVFIFVLTMMSYLNIIFLGCFWCLEVFGFVGQEPSSNHSPSCLRLVPSPYLFFADGDWLSETKKMVVPPMDLFSIAHHPPHTDLLHPLHISLLLHPSDGEHCVSNDLWTCVGSHVVHVESGVQNDEEYHKLRQVPANDRQD